MTETCDGFKIADEDLKMRGPGDFFGSRQHGLPELKIADMMQSIEALRQAIEKELDFADGFSAGVIDALVDRIEVHGTDDQNLVRVSVSLKALPDTQQYTVQRKRGKTSVCSRVYICSGRILRRPSRPLWGTRSSPKIW